MTGPKDLDEGMMIEQELRNAKPHLQSRSVAFSKNVQGCHTLALDDYTAEEYQNSWYLDAEYDDMVNDCFKIIIKMTTGKRINKKKYSARGLERMTPDAQDAKHLLRTKAFIAVQQEQSRQESQGICDPAAIAASYRKAISEANKEMLQ